MFALRRRFCGCAALALCLTLSACTSSSGDTPPPTSTVTSQSGCVAVPDFVDAGSPTLGAHFSDVGFPSGTVATVSAAPEANGFQYRLVHSCVTGNTADAVAGFYSTNLASQGWMASPTLPVSGDLSSACATLSHCWIKNDGAIRFLGLEDVAAAGPVITFTLRLVIQPLSFGGALLSPGNTYDFDPTGPGSGTDDITWTGSRLTPSSGTGLHNVGSAGLGTVNYSDAASFTYAASPLTAGTLGPGDVFAVKTSGSHFAKVRVVSHTGTTLNIEEICYTYTF